MHPKCKNCVCCGDVEIVLDCGHTEVIEQYCKHYHHTKYMFGVEFDYDKCPDYKEKEPKCSPS